VQITLTNILNISNFSDYVKIETALWKMRVQCLMKDFWNGSIKPPFNGYQCAIHDSRKGMLRSCAETWDLIPFMLSSTLMCELTFTVIRCRGFGHGLNLYSVKVSSK